MPHDEKQNRNLRKGETLKGKTNIMKYIFVNKQFLWCTS